MGDGQMRMPLEEMVTKDDLCFGRNFPGEHRTWIVRGAARPFADVHGKKGLCCGLAGPNMGL